MKYAMIKKDDLSRWFDSLKDKGKIYGPKKKQNDFVFAPIKEFEEMSLEYIPTILPPKKYFFPAKEQLLDFQVSPFKTKKAIESFEKFILFAAHTCDIAGIQCMDIVFKEKPEDPNYLNRKERMTIIGYECMHYCDEYASCTAVDTHFHKGGYDIMLSDLDGHYAMHINSDRGESLVSGKSYIREMTDDEHAALKKVHEEKAKRFKNEFKGDLKAVDAAFERGFQSKVWEDVGKRCVGCTNCTAVCPTCYCFDVTDDMDLDLKGGTRSRMWSYCQMEDFAKVAGGEDFREGRDSRQRHRYYRKFQYPVKKFNKYFCTGCGRCTRACMAKINLIETVNALIDDEGSAT